jgi:hypothetical protein
MLDTLIPDIDINYNFQDCEPISLSLTCPYTLTFCLIKNFPVHDPVYIAFVDYLSVAHRPVGKVVKLNRSQDQKHFSALEQTDPISSVGLKDGHAGYQGKMSLVFG